MKYILILFICLVSAGCFKTESKQKSKFTVDALGFGNVNLGKCVVRNSTIDVHSFLGNRYYLSLWQIDSNHVVGVQCDETTFYTYRIGDTIPGEFRAIIYDDDK